MVEFMEECTLRKEEYMDIMVVSSALSAMSRMVSLETLKHKSKYDHKRFLEAVDRLEEDAYRRMDQEAKDTYCRIGEGIFSDVYRMSGEDGRKCFEALYWSVRLYIERRFTAGQRQLFERVYKPMLLLEPHIRRVRFDTQDGTGYDFSIITKAMYERSLMLEEA